MDKDILLHGLEERYSSIRIIRERVYNITIWSLGLLLGLAGSITQIEKSFSCYHKLFFIIVILLSWGILFKFYLNDLQKGFNIQREVAGKLEDELGFYSKKKFLFLKKETLYPEAWKKPERGNFFRNSYIIIGFGFVSLLLSIILFL